MLALDAVAKIQSRKIDPRRHRSRAFTLGLGSTQGDQGVLRICPGDCGHIGRVRRAEFKMIGAPIGIDDEVGANVGPRRLDEDVNAARCRSEEHTSELQSLMRIPYAVFCLKKQNY